MEMHTATELYLDRKPWPQWPPEAQRIARKVLEQPTPQYEYFALPTHKRHSWLAAKVESALATPIDSEWVLL